MFYRPRLPDGKLAPLPWQIRLFFINANWPLNDKASLSNRLFINFALAIQFAMFLFIIEAEFHYVLTNRHNLSLMLEGLLTCMVSTEQFLRMFNMTFKRNGFKNFITEFYASIFIERTPENIEIFDQLQRKSLPTRLCSYTYLMTLFTYFLVPVMGFFNGQQLFPFRMILHFDCRPLSVYTIVLLISMIAGFWVTTNIGAEANIMAILILNLNGRYLILQRELIELKANCSKDGTVSKDLAIQHYREGIVKILQHNCQLNQFAHRLQDQYSFRIFVLMALSAIMLCVLSFKIVTVGMSSQIITFGLWILAKIVELVIFGEIGSTIIDTTNNIGLAYYQCNWESIIEESKNAKENIKIMKLISIAIELNQKPITFMGLNFFPVSLTSVITILQGAGSYFTFLRKLN